LHVRIVKTRLLTDNARLPVIDVRGDEKPALQAFAVVEAGDEYRLS
jgi:hypothetical protein